MTKSPIKVNIEADKTYYWCTCGLSAKQPFCDGAHKGTEKKSLPFKEATTEDRFLCACKATKNPPYCDGSHNN